RKPIPILQTPFIENKGQFSPDGKWIAYDSNASGAFEVYIRAFPSSAGAWQISNRGGGNPRWRADGKELFYMSLDSKMMAATIRTTDVGVRGDTPHELFATLALPSVQHSYDVSADGQRFLISPQVEGRNIVPPLTVIVNWDTGLKK